MSVQAPSRPPRAPVAAVGEPIRLLSFLDVFAPAGTEGQVVTLAQALDPARFALRFGCFELSRVDAAAVWQLINDQPNPPAQQEHD